MDLVGSLRAAAGLLTRLPVAMTERADPGAGAFPIIGALLGMAAAVPVLALPGERLVGAVLALAVMALATGALHLDGLADTVDALAAPDRERAERARTDPSVGAAGAVALVLGLGAAAAAVTALPVTAAVAALVAGGAVSRTVPPLAALRAPRGGEGFGAWFAARVGRRDAVLAGLGAILATALAAVAAVAGVDAAASPAAAGTAPIASAGAAVVAGAVVGLIAGLGVIGFACRRLGRIPGDVYGAGVEVAFVATLVVVAVVLP